MIYKNQKEITIGGDEIVSICIYADDSSNGQISTTLNTTKKEVFSFSNGFNEGYIEYNPSNKTITVNGNINTYIVVI